MLYNIISIKKENLKTNIKKKGFTLSFLSALLGKSPIYMSACLAKGYVVYDVSIEIAETLDSDWDDLFEIKKIREV